MLMEPEERVSGATFLVFLLEVSVFLRICPMIGLNRNQRLSMLLVNICSILLTYVLSGTSSATSACRRGSLLSIGTFGVLLLNMCIKGWITQISLHAIITFKVASLHVVLRPPFSFSGAAIVAILVIIIPTLPNSHFATIVGLLLLSAAHHILILILH